jgi:perosamine synthetase
MRSLENLIVNSSQSIRDAMKAVTLNAHGLCFVTENQRLVGVATDGDLRRALLNGALLESSIKDAMNTNFVALPVNSTDSVIRKTFSTSLKMIPLCDDKGHLVDVADLYKSHSIPLLEPQLIGNELEYVQDCIKTNWISSQGKYVQLFEQEFEKFHSGMQALTVSNGTVALHLALYALGVGKGDEVIVPNITFAATINSVLHCNAIPVLCEINPITLCIDPLELEKLISPSTKAILIVHLYGQVCNMSSLMELAKKHNLLLIEDCAESIGSTWNEIPVGCFGDASTFSFFGNKTISTGEGGMVMFKNNNIAKRARILRDHGMVPGKKYWHEEVGFNYRLTNLQAAIGVAQMERFPLIIQKKLSIARSYTKKLINVPQIAQLPKVIPETTHSNWLYTIIFQKEVDRNLIITKMLERGIDTRPVFYPLHEMPPYMKFRKSKSLDHSIRASQSGISLPSSVSLKDSEIEYISDTLIRLICSK